MQWMEEEGAVCNYFVTVGRKKRRNSRATSGRHSLILLRYMSATYGRLAELTYQAKGDPTVGCRGYVCYFE
jgi:hypothetical protein